MGRTFQAGRLDREVTLKKRTVTSDAKGGMKETYAEFATVWAGLVPNYSREESVSDSTMPIRKVRLRVRYRKDIEETMRVVVDGKEYDITAVEEIGRREGLTITAVGKL